MNVHRSSLTKNNLQMTWYREIFRDNDCRPLSITVYAIHDPIGLGLEKQNQASSYCLVY